MRLFVAAFLVALTCIAPPVAAKGGSHSATKSTHSTSASHGSGSHSSTSSHSGGSRSTSGSHNGASPASGSHSKAAPGVHRDAHGKIARSEKARDDFKHSHPCPSTGKSSGACPGYVIDHITPLKRGGADAPYNMQWQTKAAARQKDKRE